jgi:GNAT superfamily N-acetyltransferase
MLLLCSKIAVQSLHYPERAARISACKGWLNLWVLKLSVKISGIHESGIVMTCKIIFEDAPSQTDLDRLSDGIEEYTAPRAGASDRVPLTLLAYDENNRLVGGLDGNTEKGWLYISALWVSETARGTGLGSQLMKTAEEEAFKRNCHDVYLDTLSCQAPGFYQKLGYSQFAVLENFPGQITKIFFRKRILA